MAIEIQEREQRVKQQVQELLIEINQNEKNRQVDLIINSDFYRSLSEKVKRLRAEVQSAPSDEQ